MNKTKENLDIFVRPLVALAVFVPQPFIKISKSSFEISILSPENPEALFEPRRGIPEIL